MTCFSLQRIYNSKIQNLRKVASHYWRKHHVSATNQRAGFYSCAYLMFLPKICFASFRSSTKDRSRSSAHCRKQREAFFNLKHTMAFHWVRLVLRGLHHLLDNISLTMGSRQGNQEEKNACYTYIHLLRSNLQWNRKHYMWWGKENCWWWWLKHSNGTIGSVIFKVNNSWQP